VTAAASGVLVALAGMFSVLVVQARANSELMRSNSALAAANERERARFNLAMDAVGLFHGEVSADLLLKEKPFEGLRNKLLRGAADFYGKLEGLLAGQTDRPSRAALARAYHELAELTETIGSKPEAIAVRRKALAVRRELAAATEADVATRTDVAQSLLALGWIQYRTGDISGALSSYEEARRLAESLMANVGAGDLLQATSGLAHERIGMLFQETGKLAEAQASFERALAIRQKLADAHPDVTQFWSDLGTCYYMIGYFFDMTGKTAEALNSHERALVIRQKAADANPSVTRFQSDLASSYQVLGYHLQLAGKSADALTAFKRALTIRQSLADANLNATDFQFDLSHTHQMMAWALKRAGKLAEAADAYERAIAILQKVADANPSVTRWQSDLAVDLAQFGALGAKTGRTADAVASCRQAIAIWTHLSSRIPNDLYNLACAHSQLAGLAAEPGSGMTAAEGQAEANRAIDCLRQAVAAGYRRLILLRTDTDLDALRSRPDFQLLFAELMDLEFPDDPIARSDGATRSGRD
jgi:tetratricopeptide (TPR) repeat protein